MSVNPAEISGSDDTFQCVVEPTWQNISIYFNREASYSEIQPKTFASFSKANKLACN
jgi:hypothetical protein